MTNIQRLTYWTGLNLGMHIGHGILNTYFYSTWIAYVWLKPFNLVLINLFKSIILARTGFITLAATCEMRGSIWFVDLDPINKHYKKYAANLCGEFSWQGRWVVGALSNYETFSTLISKLRSKERVWHNARQKWFVGDLDYWLKSKVSWPRYVFTQSVHTTQFPVREAFYLGIPCFGVVDTNAYSNTVSIAFPGNDDSLTCLSFYNELIVNFILKRKFEIILLWFQNILKKENREVDEWFNNFNIHNDDNNFDFKYHKHEYFEMDGFTEYVFDTTDKKHKKFNYLNFLNKFGIYFNKLIKNTNYFYQKNVFNIASHLDYRMNRFFKHCCWMNDFTGRSIKNDSFNIWIRSKKKGRFGDSLGKYNSMEVHDACFHHYFIFYISHKFSKFKSFPSYNITVNSGVNHYFNNVSKFIGYSSIKIKDSCFYFNSFVNSWSKGNYWFNEIKNLSFASFDANVVKKKFINDFNLDWFKLNIQFIKIFKFTNPKLKDWFKVRRNDFLSILNTLKFVVIGPSFSRRNKVESNFYNKLLRNYTFIHNKITFYINVKIIRYMHIIIDKLIASVDKYYYGNLPIISNKTFKRKKRFYLGLPFKKKLFYKWEYHPIYEGWFSSERRFWQRKNKNFDYKTWFKKRKLKKYNLKFKALAFTKEFIKNYWDVMLGDNVKSYLFRINKLIFINKLKDLVHHLSKTLKNYFYIYDKYNSKYNKRELLLLFFYITNIKKYEDENNFFINKFMENYKNSLLITRKLKYYNSGIVSLTCNSLVSLMHSSQGSGFDWTWDEFAFVNDEADRELKRLGHLWRLEWNFRYPWKLQFNIFKNYYIDRFFKHDITFIFYWKYYMDFNDIYGFVKFIEIFDHYYDDYFSDYLLNFYFDQFNDYCQPYFYILFINN